ncbi:MAG TPA: glycosyltransferase [Chryseosolibacter sp.]
MEFSIVYLRMDPSKLFAELLVVIVLYKRRPEESTAYRSLLAAFGNFGAIPEIFIYDNSPAPCRVDGAIAYVHDAQNNGVSKAYNAAVAYGSSRNKKWMALLDQDTTVHARLFEKWAEARATSPAAVAFVPIIRDRSGIVSPFRFSAARGRRLKNVKGSFPLSTYRFINSGLFIQRDAFIAAGGYDERLPLDFSDIAFGEKLMRVTDRFIVLDTSLIHHLSSADNAPLGEALTRFTYFNRGAMLMGKQSDRPYAFFLHRFLRAIRLSLRYKNGTFIGIFLRHCLDG